MFMLIKGIFLVSLTSLTAYIALHYVYMPKKDGEVFLNGADRYMQGDKQDQIVIRRDKNTGVAHIEAETLDQAVYA
jgi:hypothetical protein